MFEITKGLSHFEGIDGDSYCPVKTGITVEFSSRRFLNGFNGLGPLITYLLVSLDVNTIYVCERESMSSLPTLP